MQQRDTHEIDSVETLEVVNHPLRLRLLHLMVHEPASVRELAEALGVPVTRLYYHVHLLEEHGMIGVVETRKVGAMVQKLYRTVAREFRPGRALIDSIQDDRKAAQVAVATVLDGARVDAEAALARHFTTESAGESGLGTLARTYVQLDPDRFDYWTERINALIEDMTEEAAGRVGDAAADIFTLTVVFARSVGPVKGAR